MLDRAFLVGVVVKGVDGLAELLLGIPLLVLGATGVQHLATLMTAGELREDPGDLIAHLILSEAGNLAATGAVFAALYLVLHGIVKLVLAVAVLRGAIWAYPWMLAALVAFLVLQCVQLAIAPTWGLGGLSAFDAVMIALTWVEWRRHRPSRAAGGADLAAAPGLPTGSQRSLGDRVSR